jgi:[acyl-carrier-protein] S-malonyltransferase
MLAALAADEPLVLDTFREASEVLGYDLWTLVQQGPETDLNATERTQPAMLAAGVAVWRAWRARTTLEPTVLAGHSLGEFSALVCAEAITLRDAIDLVRFRGQVMQEAMPEGEGGMAAILGLEDDAIEAVCQRAAQGQVVEAVNYNSPGQLVIAGHAAAVDRAMTIAKETGAKRALRLPISVPAHSSLLKPAGERLRERLATVDIRVPRWPVYAIGLARHDSPEAIRTQLVAQLSSAVRWTDTVRDMVAHGVTRIIECGPGKVLTGLNRRIERNKDIVMQAIDDPATLACALT